MKHLELGVGQGENVPVSRQRQPALPFHLDRPNRSLHGLQYPGPDHNVPIAVIIDRGNPVFGFPTGRRTHDGTYRTDGEKAIQRLAVTGISRLLTAPRRPSEQSQRQQQGCNESDC